MYLCNHHHAYNIVYLSNLHKYIYVYICALSCLKEKQKKENYNSNDELFGHVELKGNELYNGDCDVFAISRSKIREIVNEKQEDEFFYKVTLVEIFVDENGKEKESKYYVLIAAKDMDDANRKAAEYMKQGLQDMKLDAIAKTKILDLI